MKKNRVEQLKSRFARAALTCSCATWLLANSAVGFETNATVRESHVSAGNASLYVREIGQGPAVIVLHGGPDFDHTYLVPELDRLSDEFHLIYYDQRGRGRSADGVKPEDVTLASDVSDLDQIRRYFKLDSVVILGHSWGAVLALEYALRYPERVSRLILMNPAPVSQNDFKEMRKERLEKLGPDADRLTAMRASGGYKEGDPDAVAAYYRIHFRAAFARPENLDKIVERLRSSFTKEGILKARAIEDRLMDDTWLSPGYDLLPRLKTLKVPTLVINSDHEIIPAGTPKHIAESIPGARMVTLQDCGHFSYLECPAAVREQIDLFFSRK
ncbi:MAG TPA: alpha/beta fold hydrolase [Terriglobales bacterium]